MTRLSHARSRGLGGIALLLASAAAIIPAAHATGDSAPSPPTASASAPGITPPKSARRAVRTDFQLELHDAAIVRGSAGRLLLRGRPAGDGRVTSRALRRSGARLPGRSLVGMLATLAGERPVRATAQPTAERSRRDAHAARALTLASPRLRHGRLVASVRGAARPARLGSVFLRGSTVRDAVRLRGGCALAPFSACAAGQLSFAELFEADLQGADLRNSELHRAYAHGADLRGADLRGADLRGADLVGADLRGARLEGANLADATLAAARLGAGGLRGAHLCATELPRGSESGRDCRRPAPRQHPRPAAELPLIPIRSTQRGQRSGGRVKAAAATASASRVDPATPLGRAIARQARLARQAGVRVAQTTSPQGCPYTSGTDTDGDGLSDCFEWGGWSFSNLSAQQLSTDTLDPRTVTVRSDPRRADTDGDGLNDRIEYQQSGDPTSEDTDGDGLDDADEYQTYASNLNNADSDGDSAEPGGGRNSRLFDGQEATAWQTSPVDPDTDGDGLGDYVETVSPGRPVYNPVVAQLPSFEVGLSPNVSTVGINVPYTVTQGTSTTRRRASSTLRSQESTESHSASVEVGVEWGTEFENKTEVGEPSDEDETDVKVDFKRSLTVGNTNKWSNTNEATQEYSQFQEDESSTEVERGPTGCLQATLRFTNTGSVGFSLSNVQVLATLPDPDDPGKVQTLAALVPVRGNPPYDIDCPGMDGGAQITLGPNDSQDIQFAQTVSSETLLEYLAHPSPITFGMGGYTVTTADGRPLTQLEQDVNAKTGAVIVDFGGGRIEQFRVAAAVRRDATGRAAGTSMDTALGVGAADLNPRYGGGADGRAKLVSLAGVADARDPNQGLWTVVGNAAGIADATVDFPDITLSPGTAAILTYLDDSDDDGLPDAEEVIHGTSPTTADTDGDGLVDKTETQTGWTVPLKTLNADRVVVPSYRVFSSPLSCDADGDGSPDGPGPGNDDYGACPSAQKPESTRASATQGTDPKQYDTNMDGTSDGRQPYPDVLQYVSPDRRRPQFVQAWGGKGSGDGRFNGPGALAFDGGPQGRAPTMWVADPSNKVIQKFSLSPQNGESGAPAPPPPYLGAIQQDLERITGIAVSPEQHDGHNIVWSLSWPPGLLVEEALTTMALGRWDSVTARSAGSPILEVLRGQPTPRLVSGAIDVDASGNLYVATAANTAGSNYMDADTSMPLPTEYSPSGKKVRTFGSKPVKHDHSSWTFPESAIANAAGIAVGPAGDVYVTDALYPHSWGVRHFSSTGTFLGTLSLPTMRQPAGVTVDDDGFVYVVDQPQGGQGGNVVYKLSPSLTVLATFGGAGNGGGLFNTPVDVETDPQGNVYVTDRGNDLVQVFAYPYGEGTASGD